MTQRLLYVTTSLDRAGAEQQMVALATTLAARGQHVAVCAIERGGALEKTLSNAGVETTVLGRRWSADPRAFRTLAHLIRRWQPDVIHSFRQAAHPWAYAAARLATDARWILTQHRFERRVGMLGRWIERMIAQRAAAIVVNSQADLALGWPRERLRAIPNGVAPSPASPNTRLQVLAELGLPGTARLIGSAGRLAEPKRLKDLIWSADLLQVIRDDVHLLLWGDGPHRCRLMKFAEQANVAAKVHFLGQRSDVERFLPHLDIYASTSGREGHARGILEAMAAGVPVVASDIPGTRELVVPGETGFLAPRGDRAAIARHCNRLLGNADLAARLGAAGRQRASDHFSLEAMVARYAELYA